VSYDAILSNNNDSDLCLLFISVNDRLFSIKTFLKIYFIHQCLEIWA
jgi:hypothetical protein